MSNTVNINKVLETLRANSGRKGSSRFVSGRVYTSHPDADVTDVRLSPQAIVLVGAILSASAELSEPEMFEVVQNCSEELKTKQEPWKVFQYYRKSLIECGLLSMTK